MHEVLVNRLGGLSLPGKSVVRLTDRPDMTVDVDRGRKTTQQQEPGFLFIAKAPKLTERTNSCFISLPWTLFKIAESSISERPDGWRII